MEIYGPLMTTSKFGGNPVYLAQLRQCHALVLDVMRLKESLWIQEGWTIDREIRVFKSSSGDVSVRRIAHPRCLVLLEKAQELRTKIKIEEDEGSERNFTSMEEFPR